LYFLQKEIAKNQDFISEHLNDLCASIQATIIEILLKKMTKAASELGIKEIAIAGGVSANSGLRNAINEAGDKHGWKVYIPRFEYCTDNAAMIAITGKYMFDKGVFADQTIAATARYAISEVNID
jgi:N6-L-threonylcarbamoyladenine synthase